MKRYIYALLTFFVSSFSTIYCQSNDILGFTVKKLHRKDSIFNINTDNTINSNEIETRANNTSYDYRNSNEVGATAGELSVSLSGAANYSIPVMLPPGVKDVVPSIGLNFTSQAGNGLAGWGWNISGLSTISRIPSTKYHDGKHDGIDFKEDRYALDGQRLILKSGTYGASGSVYQTENFSNIKIIAYGSSNHGASYGPSHFAVFYPNGAIAWYGNGGNSRSRLEWAIHKWEDPQEVPVHYSYQNDNGLLSIKNIRYGGKVGHVSHMNQINFTYVTRVRPEKVYIGGNEFTRTNLLKHIQVVSKGQQFRKYTLNHDTTYLGYQRLRSAQEFNAKNKALNPIHFYYGNSGAGLKKLTKTKLYPGQNYKRSDLIAGNFDDDGKTDIIVFDKYSRNKIALVNKLFNSSSYAGQPALYPPIELNFSKPFTTIFPTNYLTHLNDINTQQGITVVKEAREKIYFQTFALSAESRILQQNVKLWDRAPTYKNPTGCRDDDEIFAVPKQYISGDFNGDGLTDVLAITKEYSIDRCDDRDDDRGGGYDVCDCYPSERVRNSTAYLINLDPRKKSDYVNNAGDFIASIESKDRITTIDFNGDGRLDIAHFKKGEVYIYTLNNNNRLKLLHKETALEIDLDKPILPGDYNGDGKTDFAIPSKNGSSNWIFFTSTGNSYYKYSKNIGLPYKKTKVENFFPKKVRYWLFGWHTKIIKIPTLLEHKYIPQDINADGKTDIISHSITTAMEDYKRNIEKITTYENQQKNTESTPSFTSRVIYNKTNTAVGKYGIPLILEASHKTHNPEYIYLKANDVYTYELSKDHKEDVSLKGIYNNGVTSRIESQRLGFPKRRERSIYRLSTIPKYPYVGINKSNQFTLVKRITETADGIKRYQDFFYKDAISHIDLGFLGFKKTTRTNWYGNGVGKLYNISEHDPELRGAVTKQWVSTSAYPSSYISKTTNTYSKSLSSKKVWTLLPTRVIQYHKPTNTTTTKNVTYDTYKNPTQEITTFNGGRKQVNYTYSNNLSVNNHGYHAGRITKKYEISTIGGNSFTTEEEYSYNSNLLTQQKAKGSGTPWNIESFKYDVFGNVTQKTLSASGVAPRTEKFKYDSSGRFLIASTDIEGLTTKFSYDTFGNPLTTTNPYGQKTTFSYDGWNRLKTEKNYLGHTTVFTYDKLGNGGLRKRTDYPQGADEEIDYNAMGWVIRSSKLGLNSKWTRKSFKHDVAGRVIRESEPYFSSPSQWNTTAYDNYGREIARTSFNGLVARIDYSGRTTTVNDGTKTVKTTKDGGGNIIKMQDPGGTITYQYHGNGIMKTANYASHVVRTEIDGWGRKTKLVDPSAGTYTYNYNNLGELLKETTPKGATSYTYDAFGKIKSKKIKGEETDMSTSYEYYNSSKLLKSVLFRGKNTKWSVVGSYIYKYDNQKRLISTMERSRNYIFLKRLERDNYGRVSSEKYLSYNRRFGGRKSNIVKIRNVYDASGILKEIRDFKDNKLLWQLKNVNHRGQALEVQLGNGHIKRRRYDQYGFLTKILDRKGNNKTSLHIDYTFDTRRGNLLKRKNNNFNWSENFTYDNLDRLTNISGAVNRSQKYDNRGRITENSDVGTYGYTSTNSYRLKALNLNTKGDLHYQNNALQKITYNAFKKPVRIRTKDKRKVDFVYGASQKRFFALYGTEGDGFKHKKIYSSIMPAEIELDRKGNSKFITYIGGDAYTAPVVHITQTKKGASNGYHYLHRDYLGSILAITDSAGNVKEQRQFGAWGEIDRFKTGNSEVDFTYGATLLNRGYTGHEHFIDVGLIHMNGRMYDPKLGRCLSPDNYIQAPYSTQSFNRFGYVWNNPLKFNDPSGEIIGCLIAGAIIGAYLGGAQANGSLNPFNWDWNSSKTWAGIIGGGIIGAVSGGIAAKAAAIITPLITSAGGFIGGAVSGAIGGLVGGAIQGGFMARLPGGNGDFFGGMWKGAVMGAVGGAVLGGVVGGFRALAKGRGFWKGTMPRAHVASSIKAKSVQSVGNSKIEAPELIEANISAKQAAVKSYEPSIKVNRGLDGARPKLTTNNYDLIESIFKTADDGTASGLFKFNNGRSIEFLANIKTQGNTLHLTDGVFYPKGVSGNQLANGFGNRAMIQTVNSLKDIARNHGFSNLRLHFIRGLKSSSVNPGHVFDRVFPLK